MANRCLFVALLLLVAAPMFAQTAQPVQQPWSGWAQCQITIQAPGYAHSETHQWKIAGGGTSRANQQFYPAAWTVIGSGSLQRVSGPTTVSAQWQVNGTLSNIEIGTTLHLDRITIQRWTGHGPARGALTGTEISTTNGVPRSRAVILDIQQWAFPGIDTGTTSARATGSNTVPFDGLRGPMNPPSGAMGTAACTWDFARGTSQASQPPTVSAQPAPTTPSSGGAVSGGAASGGGSGGTVAGGAAPGGATSGGGATGGGSGGGASAGGATADLDTYLLVQHPPSTLPANSTIDYQTHFTNRGPGSVNGAVVTVPATAGLTKASVLCWNNTTAGRTPCAASPSVPLAQAETGFAIPSLPAGQVVTLEVSATVTAASGATVDFTSRVAPPAGVSDPNPANNSYTRRSTVLASGTGGAGTSPAGGGPGAGGGNTGGSSPAGGGTADLYLSAHQTGAAGPITTLPANANITGAFSIRFGNTGPDTVSGAVIRVPASAGFSKATAQCSINNATPCLPSGVAVNIAQLEGSGIAIPTVPAGSFGVISFSGPITGAVGSPITLSGMIAAPAGLSDPNPANNSDTSMIALVASGSGSASGGSTGGVAADLAVGDRTFGPPRTTVSSNTTERYELQFTNRGPAAANGAIARVWVGPGLSITSVQCANTNSLATCPPGLSVAQLTAGVSIPNLPSQSFLIVTVSATVTGVIGSTVNVTGTLTTPSGVSESIPGDNVLVVTNTVR